MDYSEGLIALIEKDQGLAGPYFTDEAFFKIEREAVFSNNWMCIGLSADVPNRGDMFAVTALNYPLLVVRDADSLRVFHNVCSHRGAVLLPKGKRSGPRIVCPYHTWTYKLDGELVSTPHIGGAGQHACDGFERGNLGLRQVPSAEWAGHVFVNLSGTAPPFAEWIKPTDERFRSVAWSELRRDPYLAAEADVTANWKIICENFVESYHLPAVHRVLQSVNPMEKHYQILGGHSYLGQGGTAYEGDQMADSMLPLLKGMRTTRYDSLNIFPNLILAPLADMTFSIIVSPQSAERTHERIEFFFAGDAALGDVYKEARCKAAGFISAVNAEDIQIVESVQRGRHSPAFSGGQFAAAQEATSLQFQKILAARILAQPNRHPEDIVALETRDVYHAAAQ
jgi:choline monooxygenase